MSTANTTTVAKKTIVRTAVLDQPGKSSDAVASGPAVGPVVGAVRFTTPVPETLKLPTPVPVWLVRMIVTPVPVTLAPPEMVKFPPSIM